MPGKTRNKSVSLAETKERLAEYLFFEGPPQPAVTGVSLVRSPGASSADRVAVFIEPLQKCEEDKLRAAIEARLHPSAGKPLLLVTGRFYALSGFGLADLRRAQNPVYPGCSVGVRASARYQTPAVGAGTIGAIVSAGPNDYILSCNHTLAMNGRATDGDETIQPGTLDAASAQAVGKLAVYAPMIETAPGSTAVYHRNRLDCALSRADARAVRKGRRMTWTGDISGFSTVRKIGRTTGRTDGRILTEDWEGLIDFDFGTMYFEKLFGVFDERPFAAPGDSGALVSGIRQGERAPRGVGIAMARGYSADLPYRGYHVLCCDLEAALADLARRLGVRRLTLHAE